ncbi:MAG: 4'-phosphopantetheinyl transferase superfamily protein, partial [Polyangiales bacterium]
MIGDDVVDLEDEAIATHHQRARFLDRVLHPGERAALAAADSPKVLLWSFFAAKEAAYKIAVKRAATPPVFAHRAFVVSDDLRSVSYAGEVFQLELDAGGRYVHAVALWPRGEMPRGETLRAVAELDHADPGIEARALLCRTIARHLE